MDGFPCCAEAFCLDLDSHLFILLSSPLPLMPIGFLKFVVDCDFVPNFKSSLLYLPYLPTKRWTRQVSHTSTGTFPNEPWRCSAHHTTSSSKGKGRNRPRATGRNEREERGIEMQAEQVKVGKEKDEDPMITANQKEMHKAKY